MKTILLIAESHQGTFEIQTTEKKALALAKRLMDNHKKERKKLVGYHRYPRRWNSRFVPPVYARGSVEPFLHVEFKEIEYLDT